WRIDIVIVGGVTGLAGNQDRVDPPVSHDFARCMVIGVPHLREQVDIPRIGTIIHALALVFVLAPHEKETGAVHWSRLRTPWFTPEPESLSRGAEVPEIP